MTNAITLPDLDEETRSVILELRSFDDEIIPYAREVARDLGMPVEQLRQILRRLIASGHVTYGPLYRENDGMPIGSTYWLTTRGVQLRNELEANR